MRFKGENNTRGKLKGEPKLYAHMFCLHALSSFNKIGDYPNDRLIER